jgi:hypothetical protein
MSVRGIALRCRSGRIRPTGMWVLTSIYAENSLPQLTFPKERKMSETILIGGKNLHRAPGQVEVFSDGVWSLHRSNQSPCGRYQNYRLYQNLKKAKKKVFHLSFDASTSRLLQHHDVVMMQEYFPGLQEWVTDVLNGSPRAAPLEYQDADEEDTRDREPTDLSGSRGLVDAMLAEISRRWRAGVPLSTYPQTRQQGRYAPIVLSSIFDVSPKDLERTISSLMQAGRVEYKMHNKNTKLSGLCQPHDAGSDRVSLDKVETEAGGIDEKLADALLLLVAELEGDRRPWSFNKTSRRSGRYLPLRASALMGITEALAEQCVRVLIRQNRIEVFQNKFTGYVKGLRVVNKMEIDNG